MRPGFAIGLACSNTHIAPLWTLAGIAQLLLAAPTAAQETTPGGSAAQTSAAQASAEAPAIAGLTISPEEQEAEVRAHFAPAIHRPGGLTSEQAARAAAVQSPRAKAAQTKVDSAEAQVDSVVWQYLPRLTLSASYTHLSPQPSVQGGTPFNLVVSEQAGPITDVSQLQAFDGTLAFVPIRNQYALNAGLVVPVSDYLLNLSKASKGAKQGRRAAELNEQAERVSSAANARLAYYTWASAKLQAREATTAVERAQKQKETLEAQFAAGRAARADVLRADAYLAGTELDLKRAYTAEAIAREQLNVLMNGGAKSQPEWEIGEDLLADEPADDLGNKSIEDLQREGIQSRLELQSLRTSSEALRLKAGVERSNTYPHLDAVANATYANPNQRIVPPTEGWYGTWDVGLRLSWTLNSLGIQAAQAKQSEASAREMLAQAEGVEDALRAEVLGAYRTHQEALLARSSAQRGLTAAEAAHRDRKILFDNGRATSLDLLESETTLVDARLSLVRTYLAARQARVRLEHAIGRDIPGTLAGTTP